MLRKVETRMSENILNTMYCAMRIDGKITDEYCVVQWISEPYTLQKNKEMKGYTPRLTAYTG